MLEFIYYYLGFSLFQIGNYIEPVLVEIRDIKYIFAAAKSKR